MDRIKTKFVIAVSDLLRTAPESEAKVDLIEEVSENLYQRYLEFCAEGMDEAAAYEKALEELGDVEELRGILDEGAPEGDWKGDFGQNIEVLVRNAMDLAQDAVSQGQRFVKGAAEKFRQKYPDGVSFGRHINIHINDDDTWGIDVDEDEDVEDLDLMLGDANARRVEVKASYADVTLRLADDDEGMVTAVGRGFRGEYDGEGTVRITQTGSASEVEIILPRRQWEQVSISTASGDVEVESGLEAGELILRSASGDVKVDGFTGRLWARSTSGDVTVDGELEEAEVASVSGDVLLRGRASGAVRVSTTSGDAVLDLAQLPQKMVMNSRSGDCRVRVPEGQGFTLSVRTGSGDLRCNLPLERDGGCLRYLDGGESRLNISTSSGDVYLRRKKG